MNRTGNPFMNSDTFQRIDATYETARTTMTVRGTMKKSGIMFLLLMAAAVAGWAMPVLPLAVGGLIAAFVLVLVTAFQRDISPITAPIYSVLEGYALGAISLVISTQLADNKNPLYHYAVPIAALGTIATLGVMLGLYSARIIRVTDTMRSVIMGATLAIAITYGLSLIIGLFAPQFVGALAIYKSGPIGIGFSLFVIGLAAMNFLIDFDNIERGAASKAPGYMEWYCALGLMITVVWLYIEILRLLSKLANNRN
jgi:uncharacterized YccA/Bax inhibitor family protein